MKKTFRHQRDPHEKNLTATQSAAIIPNAERQRFLDGLNADFAALRNKSDAWQEERP
jgi:hypothetical protein